MYHTTWFSCVRAAILVLIQDELLAIVAEREGMSADEVYRLNRKAMGWDV